GWRPGRFRLNMATMPETTQERPTRICMPSAAKKTGESDGISMPAKLIGLSVIMHTCLPIAMRLEEPDLTRTLLQNTPVEWRMYRTPASGSRGAPTNQERLRRSVLPPTHADDRAPSASRLGSRPARS